ncbi:MAG: hypothetical protein V7L20_26135 [Nostoc sp.]|uniref:hypothetical protein n=1 Tax=Nostoc sp. TaxID=1180 RepID=UPI002FFAB72B
MPLIEAMTITTTRGQGGLRPGAGRKKIPKNPIHRIRVADSIHELLTHITSQMNERSLHRSWMSDAFAQILSNLPVDDCLIDRLLVIAELPDVKVVPPGKLIQVKEEHLNELIQITQTMGSRANKSYAPPLSLAVSAIILYYQGLPRSAAGVNSPISSRQPFTQQTRYKKF